MALGFLSPWAPSTWWKTFRRTCTQGSGVTSRPSGKKEFGRGCKCGCSHRVWQGEAIQVTTPDLAIPSTDPGTFVPSFHCSGPDHICQQHSVTPQNLCYLSFLALGKARGAYLWTSLELALREGWAGATRPPSWFLEPQE